MIKYYTRACNFYFGQTSIEKIKKKQSIPLHGNKLISFDTVEILTRKTKKKINIKKIKDFKGKIKKKLLFDINQIKKKKRFKYLNFSNIPVLMGILNLTPDSFSDGGKYNNKNGLIYGKKLISEGCQILDIGGESTRPGSKTVEPNKEWKRIFSTLSQVKKKKKIISLDKRKNSVMRK